MAQGADDAATFSGVAPVTAHWSASYVGLPYRDKGRARSGADCWGLAVIVYGEQLGITLPHYDAAYQSAAERREIAALIADASGSPDWRAIDAGANAHEFDIAVFRRGRYGSHVGILLDGRRMLHMVEDGQAVIEDFRTPRWGCRLTGIHRHINR